jgi:hypothetical protein
VGIEPATFGIPVQCPDITIGVRDRGQLPPPKFFGKPWKFGQTLGKIKKIRADLSENMLKSGYFITILHKNSGKLSTAPPPPPPPTPPPPPPPPPETSAPLYGY